MSHYQYLIQVTDLEKKEIAIALLSSLGCTGFEETETSLIAISPAEIPDCSLHEVMQVIGATFSKSIIEETNWNEKWESDFQPITVLIPGSEDVFAHIRAHFHPAIPEARYDLIITPKMSFGTGHHPTTFGMITQMSKLNFEDLKVVDFGTGTAVLAVLAEKMGAAEVLAIDYDPWCIRNAEENILINKCIRIQLRESDHFESMRKPDIILANINLNIISDNLENIAAACHTKTNILLSGMLEQDEHIILDALHKFDIKETDVVKKGGWLIIAAKKES